MGIVRLGMNIRSRRATRATLDCFAVIVGFTITPQRQLCHVNRKYAMAKDFRPGLPLAVFVGFAVGVLVTLAGVVIWHFGAN